MNGIIMDRRALWELAYIGTNRCKQFAGQNELGFQPVMKKSLIINVKQIEGMR